MHLIRQEHMKYFTALYWTLLTIVLIMMCSCSSSHQNYQKFYNQHVEDANIAVSLPKWAVMPFIKSEDKEVVKSLSKGMKKIRFLYDEEDNHIYTDFKNFARKQNYQNHIYLKDDGDEITLYTREDGEHIREIILSIGMEDESVIVAIIGKMPKSQFEHEIGPRLLNKLNKKEDISSTSLF